MDMSGMDTSGMSGMDAGAIGLLTPTNMYIARIFWYIIAAFVAVLGLRHTANHSRTLWRKRLSHQVLRSDIAQPGNLIAQLYDTATAIFREISYPQIFQFSGSFTKYLTPPSLGRCLLLLAYWAVILIMLWSNTILTPNSSIYAYKWEIVAFRAAWVSVSQLPLIFCLSCKINVISIITGISYERLNWLHRWVARTLFLTVIIHWSYFYTEWSIADFVSIEISMMPMVKYGFAAWGVLGWMVLSSFGFLRAANYELFVIQHIASAGVLLWLLYMHIPAYARYNIWLSIAFVALDREGRIIWNVWRNLHLSLLIKESTISSKRSLGYETQLRSLNGGLVKVTIRNVDFSWRPGQHIYITIPRLSFIQSHPFTIANHPHDTDGCPTRLVNLYIKPHSGFTHRLLHHASSHSASSPLRALISGPWGSPPSLAGYETVILVACSSGTTFTLPLFRVIAATPHCVRQIYFHWIVRDPAQLGIFATEILAAVEAARRHGAEVVVGVHVTCCSQAPTPLETGCCAAKKPTCPCCMRHLADESASRADIRVVSTTTTPSNSTELETSAQIQNLPLSSPASPPCPCTHPSVTVSALGRPFLDVLLRPPIEDALGEAAVVGCGGAGFNAELRSQVARLSDERAVHKGTGAQGVRCWVEGFGW